MTAVLLREAAARSADKGAAQAQRLAGVCRPRRYPDDGRPRLEPPMIPLVLTFVGDDRPGLVNAVSEKIAALRRDLARKPLGPARRQIRGRGARQRPRAERRSARTGAARTRDRRAYAHHRARRARRRGAAAARSVTLDILGNERPGIVRDVTQALNGARRQHRGIRERPRKRAPSPGSRCSAPTRGCARPQTLSLDELRRALERLAGEIMVDLDASARRRARAPDAARRSALARPDGRCHKGALSQPPPERSERRWRPFPSACSQAFSRPAISTSAIISARSSASSRCRRRGPASIAWSTCTR